MPIEIINGEHSTPAVDWLPAVPPMGRVCIWSYDPVEIMRAFVIACGEPPTLPAMDGLGRIEIHPATINELGRVTGLTATYNPSGHESNVDALARWQAEFQAWRARCDDIRAVANAMIEKGKR